MAKDYTQVNFRIPSSLKDKIDKAASENEKSITAEIVDRLEQSFDPLHNPTKESLNSFKIQIDKQKEVILEQNDLLKQHIIRQQKFIEELKEFQEWKNFKKNYEK